MSGQSIRNNLTKARRSGVADSDKACFFLKRLHKLTGRSEQYMLSSLVVSAVEALPEYAPYREQLLAEWEKIKNK